MRETGGNLRLFILRKGFKIKGIVQILAIKKGMK